MLSIKVYVVVHMGGVMSSRNDCIDTFLTRKQATRYMHYLQTIYPGVRFGVVELTGTYKI